MAKARVLGVNGAGDTLWLACAEDGDLVDLDPYSITLSTALETGDALLAAVEESERLLVRERIDKVLVLGAESSYSATYSSFLPRITVETAIAFAAAKRQVHFSRLSRQKLRSALGLPQSRSVHTYADQVVSEKQSPHWSPNKRDLAAMTAIAGSKAA